MDDQGRIESIYLNGGGMPVAVDFNQVYNGSGSLISYCETDYQYTVYDPIVDNSLGSGDQLSELLQVSTTWNGPDVNNNPTSRIISQSNYTYDNAGLRLTNTTSVQQVNSSGDGVMNGSNPVWSSQRTETYTYDDLNRLATVNYGDGEQQSYQFDAMGNRTQKWDTITGTTSYSYDAANRLLTAGGNSYTNDSNGNTLTGGGRTNTWDSFNELTQSVNGGNTCQYDYGFDGLRRQQSVASGGTTTTTDYGIDGNNVLREWAVSNGTLSQQVTYLTGSRGIEYKRSDVGGLVDWYIYDGLGSVVGEIDPNGNVLASQKYDVYGNVRASAGTSQTTNHFAGGLGHSSDQATGLIYMRARYYDPATGRFLSEDQGRSGSNWFLYASDSPTCDVDSTGDDPIDGITIMQWLSRVCDSLAEIVDAFSEGFEGGATKGAIKVAVFGLRNLAKILRAESFAKLGEAEADASRFTYLELDENNPQTTQAALQLESDAVQSAVDAVVSEELDIEAEMIDESFEDGAGI